MDTMFTDISGSGNWEVIQKIEDGWSDDLKYFVQDKGGRRYLLRISDGDKYHDEAELYNTLRKLSKWNIRASKLLDTGLCNNGENTFRLFSWIEGVEMIEVVGRFSEEDQYEYGYEAGQVLRKIHQVASPSNRIHWDAYYQQKLEKKIELYQQCGITFLCSDQVVDYVEKHKDLLSERPQSLQHGDFHIGNMLLTPENNVGVIDFNRLDFGDPWEEFNRITWTASRSVSFAKGQINGYFSDNIPADFFKLMALYIGVNLIGSIPWAIPYGDKELQTILKLSSEVMEWYDNFERSIPAWY